MAGERLNRRTYLKAAGGAGAAFTLAGCLGGGGNGSGDGENVVKIGSDIPYRPFEYYNKDDKLVGFDVDIAGAVFGDQMGMKPQFEKTAWDGIIQSLNNGNFRVIMSAMTINDERKKSIDFSDPYFTAYQTIVVLKNSDITSKEDLRGKAVGVQKNTTGADAAAALKEEFGGDLQIKAYDQIQGAFDALMNNQVTAVINDNTVNAEFANQNDNVRFVKGEGEAAKKGKNAPPYLTLTVEEYGIGFRKNDDDFRKQVNEALGTIRENGTYDDIYNKYFKG